MSKYKVGDRVYVVPRKEILDPHTHPGYTLEMEEDFVQDRSRTYEVIGDEYVNLYTVGGDVGAWNLVEGWLEPATEVPKEEEATPPSTKALKFTLRIYLDKFGGEAVVTALEEVLQE